MHKIKAACNYHGIRTPGKIQIAKEMREEEDLTDEEKERRQKKKAEEPRLLRTRAPDAPLPSFPLLLIARTSKIDFLLDGHHVRGTGGRRARAKGSQRS